MIDVFFAILIGDSVSKKHDWVRLFSGEQSTKRPSPSNSQMSTQTAKQLQ